MLNIPSSAFLEEMPIDGFEILEIESNQTTSGSLISQIVVEGISLNCRPNIGNILSPVAIDNKHVSILKNFVNKEISIIQNKEIKYIYQEDLEIKKNEFNDSKNIYSPLVVLKENTNDKFTKSITSINKPIRPDERLNKSYTSFNESLYFPNVIEILNNFEEKILLPIEAIDRENYIYRFSYPLNYNNSINLKEGIGLEPFAILNTIQFKTKQEFEFNRFWSSINSSLDSRGSAIMFENTINFNNQNHTPYLENITKSTYFVKGNSLKNFISNQSYVFLDDIIKISPFFDNDINLNYANKNYNDSSFKKIFKGLKLYENIVNREENVFFKENDKFTSCGFDYSYTNSLGKNSIAFKGLE